MRQRGIRWTATEQEEQHGAEAASIDRVCGALDALSWQQEQGAGEAPGAWEQAT